MRDKKIFFTPFDEIQGAVTDSPVPSREVLPDWYKKMSQYISNFRHFRDEENKVNLTMKMCVPVLDILTGGYMITLPCDIYITKSHPGYRFIWDVSWDVVGHHSDSQIPDMPIPDGYETSPYKWNISWQIETPPNYSLLLMHPAYRFDLPFISLPGIVDTDVYNVPVTVPFFLKKDFEGFLEKGTPICQVFPVKRDKWVSEKREFNSSNLFNYHYLRTTLVRSYKKNFWQKKNYN